MKKSIYILAFAIVSIIIGCETSEPKPAELVGKHTFELLQKMQTISQADFNKHFISLEELRVFAKDTAIEETFRNAVTKVSQETHDKKLQQAYEMIKESGERNSIDWKTITFKEYVYQTRADNGILFHDGYVVFVNDEKEYVAKIISFAFNDKQRLYSLANFEPVRK